MRGAADLPGWKAWAELQGAKKILALCEEYMGISEHLPAGKFKRLHPLLSARTATGRVASQVPNVMNLPRPGRMPAGFADGADAWATLQFRAIVRAPAGHTLISADYGQIELRIAAALALRAIRDARQILNGELKAHHSKGWLVDALRRGDNLAIDLGKPEDDIEDSFDAFADRVSRAWRRLRTSDARAMADAFRSNLDPHLLTGLTLAARQGLLDMQGVHPLDWLKARSGDEVKQLKKTYAAQRQSAKALNFGLLYGMQAEKLYSHGIVDYGLSWSLEDAADSRAAWFDLFPEIDFLQIWHQLMLMPAKKAAEPMYRKNPYSQRVGRRRRAGGRVGDAAGPAGGRDRSAGGPELRRPGHRRRHAAGSGHVDGSRSVRLRHRSDPRRSVDARARRPRRRGAGGVGALDARGGGSCARAVGHPG